jgi:hypothetical protein
LNCSPDDIIPSLQLGLNEYISHYLSKRNNNTEESRAHLNFWSEQSYSAAAPTCRTTTTEQHKHHTQLRANRHYIVSIKTLSSPQLTRHPITWPSFANHTTSTSYPRPMTAEPMSQHRIHYRKS